MIPISKNKGDLHSNSNHRGITLNSHTMKLRERVVERRLRSVLTFSEQRYGFMPGKSTVDALFALRMLILKYREGQKELHCMCVWTWRKLTTRCQEERRGIASESLDLQRSV